MKIVCDSCSTKYSISDDKVRGKVFKIRCKKCSHIIVVKGTTESAAAAPEQPVDGIWHLVVDGDQVGPLTDTDVRDRLSRNEISGDNYVWKEGFSDWLRLADVPEFADVAASAPAGNELFSDSGIAAASLSDSASAGGDAGFFGSGSAGQEAARAATSTSGTAGLSGRSRAPAAEDDAFAAPVAAAGNDGADLFGALAPAAARADSGRVRGRASNGTAASGRHDGGRVENLTAQRSENSVLFSLSNLQSLAAPAPAASRPSSTQTTEGSGLIDIRAMAASTLKGPGAGGMPMFGSDSKSAEDDLPTFGAFSSAAPVLLAIPSNSGPPKWVYALVALAAVMIIAVGALAFSILGKPVIVEQPAPPPPAVAPPAPAPAVKSGAVDDKAAGTNPPNQLAEGDLPPREGGDADKDGKGNSDKGGVKSAPSKKARSPKKSGDSKTAGGSTVASAAPATPSEPEKAKPAKGSLDDLLEGALNGRKAKPKVEDDAPGKKGEAAGGGPLAKAAVVAGMNSVKGKVSACYAQFKQAGLVMVNVVIGKSGKVSSAAVTGKFAGTPTGTCVESAVKTASFPPSEGLTTPYPFTLR
ncbi:MAG: GYF domain-containing protein [Haliangium ochraceum]